MNKKTTFGIIGALLLLTFGAAAYAQGNYLENSNYRNNMMNKGNTEYMQNMHNSMLNRNITLEQMEAMHETMTQNLDPQLKIQMDAMHKQHINSFRNSDTQIGTFGMMNGNQSRFSINGCHN